MVNTRAGGNGSNQGNDNNAPPPPPPPAEINMAQLLAMQAQMMQGIGQLTAVLQQAYQQQIQAPAPPPPSTRDRRSDFLKGRPPVFTHSADPMDAEDWLRTIERELVIAQCSDREKVLYGPRQLQGAAQAWWEAYLYAHENPDGITWQEFKDRFRAHHVPQGTMLMKKEEFLALKQKAMTVGEYRDKFVQLSRYAPEEVNTDAKKQYKFMRGLTDPLQYQLMNHSFPNFQHLVDRALMTENKRREMEEKKRKLHPTSSGSNSRPRLSGPQQNYQSRSNGGQYNSGQRTNYQGPRPNP